MTTETTKVCPTCEMAWGRCRHTTEGQVTIGDLPGALLGHCQECGALITDGYKLIGSHLSSCQLNPTCPQVTDAALPKDQPASTTPAGGADLVLHQICGTYDPKCRELAEYFTSDRDLTHEQLDGLSQGIQDFIEASLIELESEGQS